VLALSWRADDATLAEAEAFAAIVRSSTDAVIAKTVDGIVTAWNDGAAALYGYTASQMLGTNIDRTFPPDQVAAELARHAAVAAGGSESGYRCQRVRGDATLVDVVMSLSPVCDRDGLVTGIGSISRAISPAEQDEARYGSLLEAAPDATVCANRDGRVVTINAQAVAMFGYDREQLLGAEVEMLLPDAVRERHAHHRTTFAENPRIRQMGTGLSLFARRRDGTTFPVEVSLSPDHSSGELLVIASIRDVTAQRELELAARENETRLRQLAESVDLVLILMQLDPPAYLYVSPPARAMLGMDSDDILTWQPASTPDMVHPDDRERVERDYFIPSRAGLPAVSEHRIVDTSGQLRWIRARAAPVANPDGPPLRSVLTVEDITDRIQVAEALSQAEAAARSANAAKNEFLSRMSHELRTPLNAVLGFGQLLKLQLEETEQIEMVDYILKGGRHLLDLINDVLDTARIDSGQMPISVEPLPVAALVKDTLHLMQPVAAEAGITLHMPVGGDVHVLADRQRLRQIVLNLVSNAIKYNNLGGNVRVSWAVQGDQFALTVADDGYGIPVERQDRLFIPFDRLGAESTGIDGAGIGLALTQALVVLMNGTIGVESSAGDGSRFTVTLPAATPPALPAEAQQSPARITEHRLLTSQRHKTLLYIEDNEPNVRVVEHLIRMRPQWQMIHAALGQLGLDLAQVHRPDLVLLDLHLPDLNGREVLAELKRDPTTADIPVVILSADATVEQPRNLLGLGAERFLTKPVDLKELLQLLDDAPAR
jgi:PAS domain S-box-containing protein